MQDQLKNASLSKDLVPLILTHSQSCKTSINLQPVKQGILSVIVSYIVTKVYWCSKKSRKTPVLESLFYVTKNIFTNIYLELNPPPLSAPHKHLPPRTVKPLETTKITKLGLLSPLSIVFKRMFKNLLHCWETIWSLRGQTLLRLRSLINN